MTLLQPALVLALVLAAAYTMVGAGIVKRRLAWRTRRCPACGRPRERCTCYWR